MAADTTTTTFMSLVLPVPGVRAGNTWASDLNTALTAIDSHDHASGKGTKVTPSGLNISSDLSFGSNQALSLKTTTYDSQAASLSSSFKNCIYVSGGDLYYNNGSGTTVQLTSAGTINVGSVQGISGLASPASAVYSSPIFTFKSAATTYGKMEHADLRIFEATAGVTAAVTIKAPTSLAASYNFVLPAAVPGSLQYLSMDTSGNVSVATGDSIAAAMTATGANAIGTVMGATGANPIGVAMSATGANAIAASMTSTGTGSIVATATSGNADTIASKFSSTGTGSIVATATAANANTLLQKVTTSNSTASNAIINAYTRSTGSTVGLRGYAISQFSSNTFTTSSTGFVDVNDGGGHNVNVTLTTSGRPVVVFLLADGSGNSAGMSAISVPAELEFGVDASPINKVSLPSNSNHLPGGMMVVVNLAAGSHSIGLQARVLSGAGSVAINYCALGAYEL